MVDGLGGGVVKSYLYITRLISIVSKPIKVVVAVIAVVVVVKKKLGKKLLM